jgi:hypothetical protein
MVSSAAGRTRRSVSHNTCKVSRCGSGSPARWSSITVTSPSVGPAGSTAFNGGEGAWYDRDCAYFTTKGDKKVRKLKCATETIEVIHSPAFTPAGNRMNMSSQRGTGSRGISYEITGPFRA